MVKVTHQLLPGALWLFPASCTSLYLLVCPVVRVDGLLCNLNSPFKVVGFQFVIFFLLRRVGVMTSVLFTYVS